MISAALIGAGYWGRNLARNMAASPSIDLRAIADSSIDAATDLATRYPAVRAVADLESTGVLDEVDAVVIATPPKSHTELVTRYLEAGKHVMVEKPVATSTADAISLADLADRSGLVLMTDHTYCYTPVVEELRRLYADGAFGTLHYWESIRVNLGRLQPDVNVVWDLAPHDLSILTYVLGHDYRPTRVCAQLGDPIGYGQPSVGHLSIEMDGGAQVHLHTSWLSPKKIRTTLIGGSERMAVWDDLSPGLRLMLYESGVRFDPERHHLASAQLVEYRTGPVVAPYLAETEALFLAVGEFAAAVEEGRPPKTDGWMGAEVLAVLEAADASAASNSEWVTMHSVRRSAAETPEGSR